ncbi:uncharacterized protein METZ01_LOCUS457823 [marine metagenome]|uniref:Uncharacterized protein n=1 Tax=marine metagenome TaxID=408172 RepID=A0A383ABL9_9ZZZZ
MINDKRNILFQVYRCLLLSAVLAIITLSLMSCGDELLDTEIVTTKENSDFILTLKVDPDILYLNSNTKVTVIIERKVHANSTSTPEEMKLDAVGGKLEGMGVAFSTSYGIDVDVILAKEVGSKFEVLGFFVSTAEYSSTGKLERFAAKGQVTSRYDGMNVSLPITIVEPR